MTRTAYLIVDLDARTLGVVGAGVYSERWPTVSFHVLQLEVLSQERDTYDLARRAVLEVARDQCPAVYALLSPEDREPC